MMGTMHRILRRVPTFASASTLAALTIAASALAMLPERAAAQSKASQLNAVRQYCRTDFKRNCEGMRPTDKDALLCLQANVSQLSPACQKVVTATLEGDAAPAPVVADDSQRSAQPRGRSGAVPIVSARPPRADLQSQRQNRYAEPDRQAQPEQLSSVRRTAARKTAAPDHQQTEAQPEQLPPDQQTPEAMPGEREGPGAAGPDEAERTQPGRAASTRAARRAAPQQRDPRAALTRDPLIRACWNDLNRHCRGMRAGGGRELACLTQHSRNLSPGCWQAYRAARTHSRTSAR